MAVATPRKPKRVVATSEALNPQPQPQDNSAIYNDPTIRSLLQTARPETAPVPAQIKQKQQEERQRQARQAAISSENNGTNGVWAFVKNQNTKELITFDDKSTFTFSENLFICRDEKLAKKILKVADRYNIVLK